MSIAAIPYPAASTVTEVGFSMREVVSATMSEDIPPYHLTQGSFRLGNLLKPTSITTVFDLYPYSPKDNQDERLSYGKWDTLALPFFPPKSEETIRVKVKTVKIDHEPPYIPPFDEAWFED